LLCLHLKKDKSWAVLLWVFKEPPVPVLSISQNQRPVSSSSSSIEISESKNRWFQLFPTKTCQRTGGSHERTGKEPSMVLLAGSSTFKKKAIEKNHNYIPSPDI
jgi:hypothetical protein